VDETIDAVGRSPGLSGDISARRMHLQLRRRPRRTGWRRLVRRVSSAAMLLFAGAATALGLLLALQWIARAIDALG
jgi:hypothetical protein